MTALEAIAALPSTIRVGPFYFGIVKASMHEAASRREWGRCETASMTISIQSDMPSPVKAVDTFLHEALHAVCWAYNVSDEDKEERLVSTISTALTALHSDNPWLAGWITQALS